MFNIGSGELLVILLVVLLVLGPKQLPEAARQLGKWIKVLTRLSASFRRELQNLTDEAVENEARKGSSQNGNENE